MLLTLKSSEILYMEIITFSAAVVKEEAIWENNNPSRIVLFLIRTYPSWLKDKTSSRAEKNFLKSKLLS